MQIRKLTKSLPNKEHSVGDLIVVNETTHPIEGKGMLFGRVGYVKIGFVHEHSIEHKFDVNGYESL